jgi:hypothetical protein
MASTNHMVIELDVTPLLSNSLHNNRILKTQEPMDTDAQMKTCCAASTDFVAYLADIFAYPFNVCASWCPMS